MNKKSPSETHVRWLNTRLTEAELHALDELLEALGTTRAEFMRKAMREATAAGPDPIKNDMKTFREAVYQLAAVGRNFNQMVRVMNSGDQPDPERLRAMLEEIRSVLRKLDQEWNAVVLRSRSPFVKLRPKALRFDKGDLDKLVDKSKSKEKSWL